MNLVDLETLLKRFTAFTAQSFEQPEVPPRPFTADELAAAMKTLESKALRSFLSAPVFAQGPEVYVEDIGYYTPTTPEEVLAANENLANARASYQQFQHLQPCFVLSHSGDRFIAVTSDEQVVTIDSNDGEVTETGLELGAFLELVHTGLAREVAAIS